MKAMITTTDTQRLEDITDTDDLKVLYKGIFLDKDEKELAMDRYPIVHPNVYYDHMTIEFNPDEFDMKLSEGWGIALHVIGQLTTDKVDVLLVEPDEEYLKSHNKYGHITLSTADGVPPYKSNEEIENHLDDIKWEDHLPLIGNALNCCIKLNVTFKTSHFLKI